MQRVKSQAGKSCLIFVLLVLLAFVAASPLAAGEPSSGNLDSGWQFRAQGNTERAGIKEWHSAQVPGVVQTDL